MKKKKKKKMAISSENFHIHRERERISREAAASPFEKIFGTIKITRAIRFNEVTNFLWRTSSPAIFQIANRLGLLPVKSSSPLRNFVLESQTRIFISREIARGIFFEYSFLILYRYLLLLRIVLEIQLQIPFFS